MSRICTQRLRALAADVLAERGRLSVSDIEIETGSDALGQPAIFVCLEIPRNCETGVLRRERLALTHSLQAHLRESRDHRHPFVYFLSAGEWPQRRALLPSHWPGAFSSSAARTGAGGGRGASPLKARLRGVAIQ